MQQYAEVTKTKSTDALCLGVFLSKGSQMTLSSEQEALSFDWK